MIILISCNLYVVLVPGNIWYWNGWIMKCDWSDTEYFEEDSVSYIPLQLFINIVFVVNGKLTNLFEAEKHEYRVRIACPLS